MEENAVEVFHYYGFHLSSFFNVKYRPFRENVVAFPFLFHIFMVRPPSRIVSHPKDKKSP